MDTSTHLDDLGEPNRDSLSISAADPTDPTKWTCPSTSDQAGIGSDQQGDVASPLRG